MIYPKAVCVHGRRRCRETAGDAEVPEADSSDEEDSHKRRRPRASSSRTGAKRGATTEASAAKRARDVPAVPAGGAADPRQLRIDELLVPVAGAAQNAALIIE